MTTLLLLGFFALLPFEYFPTIDVAGFTVKGSYLLGICLLITGAGAILRRLPRKLPRFDLSDAALLLLPLIATVSAAVNRAPVRVWVLTAMWWFVILLYVRVREMLVGNSALQQKVIQIALWVALLTTMFGVYQFLGDELGLPQEYTLLRLQYTKLALGFTRIQSVGIEPLFFSNYLFWPAAIALGVQLQRKSLTWLDSLVLVGITICLLLGISRGAYLAAAVVVVLYIALAVWRKAPKKVLVGQALMVLIGAVLSGGMLVSLTGSQTTKNFVQHATVQETSPAKTVSVSSRIMTGSSAITLFREHPILGGGVGSFGLRNPQENGEPSIVNNEYLELLAEVGVLGFIAYIVAMGTLLARWWRLRGRLHPIPLTLGLALVAHLVQQITFSTLYIITFWGFLALFASYLRQSEESSKKHSELA